MNDHPTEPPRSRVTADASPARPAPANAPPRRRVRLLYVFLGLALLAGIAFAVIHFVRAGRYEQTDDAFLDAHISRIAPQVAGRVERVLVRENQHVEVGQLLVVLDDRDYAVALQRAKADQVAAQARLRDARAAVNVASSQVEQANADITAARAQSRLAHIDLARIKRLVKHGAQPRAQEDRARSETASSDAALRAAEQRLRGAQASQVEAKAQVASAQAGVQGANVAVAQAQLRLSYTQVHAPVAGRITQKQVEPGDYLQVGQQLFAIVEPYAWVTANYKETQLTHMRRGQPVSITIDAYPGRTWRGHVSSFQHGTGSRFSLLPPENATGNYVKVVQRVPVRILFDHQPDPSRYLLAPGMSVVPQVFVHESPEPPPRSTGSQARSQP